MPASAVSVTHPREGVARVTLDRPPVNVLDAEDLTRLAAAVAQAGSARVLFLTGSPRAFSAGVSIPEHVPEPVAIDRMLSAMRSALTALIDVPAVTVAVVRGACLGGGAEIVSACDVVFVARDARVGFPEIRLGCFPPGAAALLPIRVGAVRAADWILSGRTFSGLEAAQAGFASHAAPASSVEEQAARYGDELLSRGSAALQAVTGLLRESRRQCLRDGMARAEAAYRTLAGDADLARAVREWRKA